MDEDLTEFIANLVNGVTYHLYFPKKEDESFFIRIMQNKIEHLNSRLLICSTQLTDVILENERQDKINYHHVYKSGHRGITSTIESLRRHYYWPDLTKDVTNYINNCQICQKSKYERNPNKFEFQSIPIGSKPFERIHMDTLSISKEKFLTIIDTFSKFAQAYPIGGINPVNVLDALLIFISHYGIPNTIICDNGVEFSNKNFQNFCKIHKIEIHYTTPRNPNSNSYIERFHSTLLESVRTQMQQNPQDSLNTLIRYSLLSYNNTIHSSINYTPFEIISGHFKTKNPFDIQENDIVSKYVEDHRTRMTTFYEQLNPELKQKKEQKLQKINEERNKPFTISQDDQIYHKQNARDKLAPKFSKIIPIAQTNNKIKTDTTKYSKHNIKKRKKY